MVQAATPVTAVAPPVGASQWTFDVERGPEWLFVKVHCPVGVSSDDNLASAVWKLLECQFVRRLVLEVDELPMLSSRLIGQLVKLQKQIESRDGLLRLCGLSDANQELLRRSRLDGRLPQYRTRQEAVLGKRPSKPR